jgi:hypothetical protein
MEDFLSTHPNFFEALKEKWGDVNVFSGGCPHLCPGNGSLLMVSCKTASFFVLYVCFIR